MSHQPTIKSRVLRSAMRLPEFTVMQIMADCNSIENLVYPRVTIIQVINALNSITGEGQLVKRAAGRFAWRS